MRRTMRMTVALGVLAVAAGLCSPAWATLPDDLAVQYQIHETPGDPETSVVFTVELTLHAVDDDVDSVGWEITAIFFTKPLGARLYSVWTEDAAVVDSPDGLWWVDHADTENPVLSEFAFPPLLAGTAPNDDSSQPDLDYDFVGVSYSPPPGGPPFTVTGAMDYAFTEDGEQQPMYEGDDEPVDIANGVHDPSPS